MDKEDAGPGTGGLSCYDLREAVTTLERHPARTAGACSVGRTLTGSLEHSLEEARSTLARL